MVEFDYTAQETDELTLRKGDKIAEVKTQSGGWWEGVLAGKRGMFPDNFVKVSILQYFEHHFIIYFTNHPHHSSSQLS